MSMLDIDFDFFVREHPHLDWGHGEMGFMAALADVLWQQRASGFAARDMDLDAMLTPPDDPSPEQFWDELRARGWKFSDDCKVLVSNSHAVVGSQWLQHFDPDKVSEIIHFDAHHDLGYSEEALDKADEDGWLDCATWLYTVASHFWGIDSVRLVYPEWRRQKAGDPYKGGGESSFDCMECGEDTLWERRERLAGASVNLTWEHWLDGAAPPEDEVELITICLSGSWVPPWYDKRFAEFVEAAPGEVTWLEDPLWGPDGFKPRWEASTWDEVVEMLQEGIKAHKALFAAHKAGMFKKGGPLDPEKLLEEAEK